MNKPIKHPSNGLDLSPYAGRWVALVRGRIAGVGRTSDEARRAAQVSRPKEKPELQFVTVDDWQNHPVLRRVWSVIRWRKAAALLVGGAVRDGLLGRPLHDLDFVVDGDAKALAIAVRDSFHGAFVPLDPARDVFRAVVNHAGGRFYLDFARRRGGDWSVDLQARDFTVNAIAVDPTGRYLDPLGGRNDLAAGRLRATNASAFRDDPLRTLRAVRLVAELELTIEAQTAEWIRRDARLLPSAAAERVRDEFVRILNARGAAHHLEIMDELGLLAQVLPEVIACQGVSQSPPHHWDVWTHTRIVLAAAEALIGTLEDSGGYQGDIRVPGWVWADLLKSLGPWRADLVAHLAQVVSDIRERRFALRLAALLHDLGKPQTRSMGEDGRIHFIGHEKVSADLAAERLGALRFSGDEIALVQTIVAHHLRPGDLARAKRPTRRAIYRFFRATGDAGVEVALLSLSDMLGTWGPALTSVRWQRGLDVVTTLLNAFFDQPESVAPAMLVNGHELMELLELSPGPEVGRLLEAVREAQATGEVTSRESALALAAKLQQKTGPGG